VFTGNNEFKWKNALEATEWTSFIMEKIIAKLGIIILGFWNKMKEIVLKQKLNSFPFLLHFSIIYLSDISPGKISCGTISLEHSLSSS